MKKVIIFISSILGWAVILYFIIPLITALSWFFWSLFLYKKMFIKEEFKGTLIVFLILIITGVIYYLILKIWAVYNYRRHYKRNKRSIIPIKKGYEKIEFKKIELSEDEVNELIRHHCNSNNS